MLAGVVCYMQNLSSVHTFAAYCVAFVSADSIVQPLPDSACRLSRRAVEQMIVQPNGIEPRGLRRHRHLTDLGIPVGTPQLRPDAQEDDKADLQARDTPRGRAWSGAAPFIRPCAGAGPTRRARRR